MKHETTPKTNRKLESSLLIIMLIFGLLGIFYFLSANKSESSYMILHADGGKLEKTAFLSVDRTAEVGFPTQFSIHNINPTESYRLAIDREVEMEVKASNVQHVFEREGLHAVQLLEKKESGYEVIDQFEIEVGSEKTVAAY